MKRTHALAVAAALLVGGLAGAQLTSGAATNEPASFVSITPCRLIDSRPATKIGNVATLGEGSSRVVTVRGFNGQCNIPLSATGVAMNVTAVNGTKASFLTVWPSDAVARPGTSNLNWVPGAPPTPNKVDVALSSNGKMSLYNRFGSVDVIADIVGYYEPVIVSRGTISAVEVVTEQIIIKPGFNNGSNGNAVAVCPKGMVAIAGGVENPIGVAINTRSTRPEPPTGNPTGWFADVRASVDATAYSPTVYAVCITLNL